MQEAAQVEEVADAADVARDGAETKFQAPLRLLDGVEDNMTHWLTVHTGPASWSST